MDGIYSAAREVDEESLFQEAQRLGLRELASQARSYVERALSAARQTAGRHAVPPWEAFDFIARVVESHGNPGAQLQHIGLWPISDSADLEPEEALDTSRKLVERLLGIRVTGLSVAARIDAIQLEGLDGGGRAALERFLDEADALPMRDAVRRLGGRRELWVGVVRVNSERIEAIGPLGLVREDRGRSPGGPDWFKPMRMPPPCSFSARIPSPLRNTQPSRCAGGRSRPASPSNIPFTPAGSGAAVAGGGREARTVVCSGTHVG